MSESFEFCKTVAQDVSRSSYADRSWDNAMECFETEAIFDNSLHGTRRYILKGMIDDETEISFNVDLSFSADSDFDYFTSASCVHDGTLYFINDMMNELVEKLCLAKTYNKNVGEPQNGDSIKYVIGNFVVLNEYDGDFVPADKPWLRERSTILLPLKMIRN